MALKSSYTVATGDQVIAADHNTVRKDLLLLAGDFAVTTGSSNAYVLALDSQITAYENGMRIRFEPNFANTGAPTVNVNSIGAVGLVSKTGDALASGSLATGVYYEFEYNSTTGNFHATSGSAGIGVVDSVTYNIKGQPENVTIDGTLHAIAYNAAGQVSTITIGGNTYTVTRDQQQRITSIT